MEAHAHGHVHWRPRRGSVAASKVVQVGALAGVVGGAIMAVWQIAVAAIAQQPTEVPGIHQTLWTPPEGIWSVVFGVHHFHGDFHLIPVVGGIAGHMMNSLILGLLGVVLVTTILGRRPHPVAAVILGVGYGMAVQAIVINAIINTQKIQTLYHSTPHWSWFVGHGIFGLTLGLLTSLLLRTSDGEHDDAAFAVSGPDRRHSAAGTPGRRHAFRLSAPLDGNRDD